LIQINQQLTVFLGVLMGRQRQVKDYSVSVNIPKTIMPAIIGILEA
jgi:hypothetical protein